MRTASAPSESRPQQIARAICRDYLECQRLRPSERLPNVRDLAGRYAASTATISQALGLLQSHNLVTKGQGRGSFLAGPGSFEQRVETRLIGLVLPGPAIGQELGSLHEGVQRSCRDSGCHPLVLTSDWDYDTERRQVASAFAAGCAGVVLYPMPRLAGQLRRDYLNREHLGRPIVLVDMAQRTHKRTQVLFDNARAAREITAELIRAGHQRIAFVHIEAPDGRLAHRSNHDRYVGHLAAMRAAGLAPRPHDQWQETFPEHDPAASATAQIRRWLQQPERATAVIAASDFSALCLAARVRAEGMRVPQDLTVVGFDNLRTCHPTGLSFPTTAPDFGLAGEVAADLLLEQCRGELREPTTYMLPVPVLWPPEGGL